MATFWYFRRQLNLYFTLYNKFLISTALENNHPMNKTLTFSYLNAKKSTNSLLTKWCLYINLIKTKLYSTVSRKIQFCKDLISRCNNDKHRNF